MATVMRILQNRRIIQTLRSLWQSIFYNMEVEVDDKLETRYKGLYIIGDGSGITHSLSHASASGVYVARNIAHGE